MKKIMYFLILITILIVAAFAASAQENQPEKVRVFIEFKGNPDVGMVTNAGGKVLHSYTIIPNVLAVELPEKAMKGVLQNPNVIGMELDAKAHIAAPPEKCTPWPSCRDNPEPDPEPDPEPSQQELPWGIDRIGANDTENNGYGITVCVVDTGIDKDHPDLAANIIGGKNFVKIRRISDYDKWDDDNGHGTHVAGTIAAIDNEIGVVGVAPNVSLIAAKVLDRRGSGYLSDVIAGIDYCVTSDADIISMSLGTSSDVPAMHDAVDAAYAKGALIVAAAGNSNSTVSYFYPAAYDSVIAVSATDENDNKAYFSNWGPEIELAAPGVYINSTCKGGIYCTKSGTSMSAPHVSGVAALAMQANLSMNNTQIRTLLQNTTDDLGVSGWDNLYGYGLVDAELI